MGSYILRHKIKNPNYATEEAPQWFDLVDIFKTSSNKYKIELHGILQDDDSVSTNNIKDLAINTNKIQNGAITIDKLDPNVKNAFDVANGGVTPEKMSDDFKLYGVWIDSNKPTTNNNLTPWEYNHCGIWIEI